MPGGDKFQVVYVDGDVPQLPIQLGQLLVDSSQITEGTTNLQQCTSQDPLVYEPLQGGYPVLPGESGVVDTNRPYWDSRRYATLQDALDSNAGSYLQVIGAYTISASLSVGAGTYVFAKGTDTSITQTVSDEHIFECDGDSVTVDGLTLIGENTGTGSAVRADDKDRIHVLNCVVRSWRYGINLLGVTNSSVRDNFIYGGAYDSSGSADIRLYGNSGTLSQRNIIVGNWCLSNNDIGISVDTNSGDKDTVIIGNVIVPLDTDGLTPLDDADNRRRFGIIAGYNGTTAARTVITGNLVRDVPYIGIYSQGATRPGGDLSITGNLVYRCGFGTFYSPTDDSLRAGIFSIGGADTITGNTVLDCVTSGIKIAPDFTYNATTQPRGVVSANVVARTVGKAIFLTNKPHGYLISANRVINSTEQNIYYETTSSDGGNCVIDGNHIDTTATNVPGILVANTSGGYPVDVKNNVITGDDNSTNNEFNSGIWFNGLVRCVGNSINTFHRGINRAATVSVRDTVTKAGSNTIKGCAVGINCGGDGPWLVDNNTFDTCTNNLGGGAVQGTFLQGAGLAGVIHTALTAAPTVGTWAVGDTVDDSIPVSGAQMGWKCTVAGTPGTWVAMANMA